MGVGYNYVKYRVAECVCFLLFGVRVELLGNYGDNLRGVMVLSELCYMCRSQYQVSNQDLITVLLPSVSVQD